MTTPNGAIVFNATSGSDTAASGLGPATALYGSGATTDGTAVVTGISTTGASAGDLLWVQTASGRQFSIIASVDSGTQVTCDDTFSAGLGQTWAIGGKRATWDNSDSRRIFYEDQINGSIIETETDQNITSSGIDYGISLPPLDSPITVQGSSESTLSVIDQSANTHAFIGGSNTSGNFIWKNLKFQNSNVSTTTNALNWRGGTNTFINCEFGDSTNVLNGAFQSSGGVTIAECFDCVFHDLTDNPYPFSSNTGRYGKYFRCISYNNQYGFHLWGSSLAINCIAYDNSSNGIHTSTRGSYNLVINCVVQGNGGDGILIASGYGDAYLNILNTLFSDNSGYGINENRTAGDVLGVKSFNYGYNNTSGFINGGAEDSKHANVSLTADPFTDSAAGDFTLNDTAGGGAALKAGAITLGSTETRPFRWLDAAAAGTGSSSTVHAKFVRLD